MPRSVEVHDAAEGLGPHQQGVGLAALEQQAPGHLEAVEEAGAAGVQVKAGDVLGQAQVPLDGAGHGGGGAVGADSAAHAGAQVLRGDPGPLQGQPGRLRRPGRPCSPPRAEVPGLDAGAGADPLVAGLHEPAHIVVGDHLGGQAPAGGHDLQSLHGLSFPGPASPIPRNFS